MKIVRIFGGLGNQMFQYALAIALKEEHANEDIFIDSSCMKGYPLHNGYELCRIFNTPIRQASITEVLKVAYPTPHYRLWQLSKHFLPKKKSTILEDKNMTYIPNLIYHKESCMIEGYWQTELYFAKHRNSVIRSYQFPKFEEGSKNQLLSESLKNKESVSIHVRRGDYLKICNTSGICTLEYYEMAISEVLKRSKPNQFVIFSDDPTWCKINLKRLFMDISTTFVDWNNGEESYRDMQLMSLCTHNIIANSSFSWWGAWLNLNPKKIVIAPSRWMNGPGWPCVIPESWIKIQV